jgi:hypothetical protein
VRVLGPIPVMGVLGPNCNGCFRSNSRRNVYFGILGRPNRQILYKGRFPTKMKGLGVSRDCGGWVTAVRTLAFRPHGERKIDERDPNAINCL